MLTSFHGISKGRIPFAESQERQSLIGAQISADERKQRTKHLIETGAAVYAVLGDSFQDGDIERLTAFLKSQNERGGYFSKAMGRNKAQ